MALSLSVVLCTFERPDHVLTLLPQVLDQLPPGAEIVVVDQSREAAREAVAAWIHREGQGRVRLRGVAEPGLPSARNIGIEASSGEIVLFLDDDVRLRPGALQAHLAAYRDPRVGGVVGQIIERVVRPNAAETTNRVDRGGRVRTRLDGDQKVRVEALKGANMSVRRAALLQAGPFDPGYGGTAFLEDVDLSERLIARGWELWFIPEAAVEHLSAPSGGVRAKDQYLTEWWRFRNTAYFLRRHRSPVSWAASAGIFGAIASKRGAQWRAPWRAAWLMSGWYAGFRSGSRAP